MQKAGKKIIKVCPSFDIEIITLLLLLVSQQHWIKVLASIKGEKSISLHLFRTFQDSLIFHRPGVAGAVLHTALSLIHSFSQSVILFLQIFILS